jgi:hypothetical protein
VRCDAVQPEDQIRKYKPHSDFLISKSNLPRLLVEVNSTPTKEWPPDLIRMLLMGAAVVRFANKFLDAYKNMQNFALCAMFIHDDGEVSHFTLFQDQNNKAVC